MNSRITLPKKQKSTRWPGVDTFEKMSVFGLGAERIYGVTGRCMVVDLQGYLWKESNHGD